MLYISPWKTAAILLTTLFVCLFAVPNFFGERVIKSWPTWAQRHMVLGLDLQDGSHILLEVDSAAVRREKPQTRLDDVRRTLRDARGPDGSRVQYTGLAVRGDHVEVRVTTNQQLALTKLRELSQPLGGLLSATGGRTVEISDTGSGAVQ